MWFCGCLTTLTLAVTGCSSTKVQDYTEVIRDNEVSELEQVDALASDLGIDVDNSTESEIPASNTENEEDKISTKDSQENQTVSTDTTQQNLEQILEYLGTDKGLKLCDYDVTTTPGDCNNSNSIIASTSIEIDGKRGVLALVGLYRGEDAIRRIEAINKNKKILADLNNTELEYCVVDYVIALEDEISETSSDIGLNIKGWNSVSDEISDCITVDEKKYSGGGVYFNSQKEDKINVAGSGEYVFTLPKRAEMFALVFKNDAIIKIR